MTHEALWKALKHHLRELQLHAQADMATLEAVNDVYRAQGFFRAVHDLQATVVELEEAMAEGRLLDTGEVKPAKPPPLS